MNILLMGGTQFVSKELAKYMINKGYKVSIFTRNQSNLDYEGIEEHFIGNRKNATDLESLRNKKFDVIYDISAYTKEDVELLYQVLDKQSLKKYILCSSGAVYLPSVEYLNEKSECGYNENWGEYGTDKLSAETFLQEKSISDKVSVSIVRPSYIYGAGNNLYRESYFFEKIEKGEIIPIPDSSSQIQFVYISDLLKIFDKLLYMQAGGIYNVTNPEVTNWEKLVRCAALAVGRHARIKKVHYQGKLKAREFFPFRDCTYLLDVINLEKDNLPIPNIGLEDGMKLAYDWYKNNSNIDVDKKMNKIEEAINL